MRASVSPSEDPHLVAMAVARLLGCPEDEVQIEPTEVIFKSGGTSSLARIKDQLRDRRVRGAARKLLLSSMEKGKSFLMLNRQAATVGIAAICSSPDESPLGPIYLTLKSDDVKKVIEWLTSYEGG